MSNEEKEIIRVLIERIDNLTERLERFEEMTDKRFVTNAEFWPVKTLVYGCVGVVLISVVAAALAVIIKTGV